MEKFRKRAAACAAGTAAGLLGTVPLLKCGGGGCASCLACLAPAAGLLLAALLRGGKTPWRLGIDTPEEK